MDTGIIWKQYDGKNMLSVANKFFPEPYLGNHNRYYDSTRGQYDQPDPRGILLDFSDPERQVAAMMGVPTIDAPMGYLNHNYGYADQNPIMYTDPTGEGFLKACAVIIIGAIAYEIYCQDEPDSKFCPYNEPPPEPEVPDKPPKPDCPDTIAAGTQNAYMQSECAP